MIGSAPMSFRTIEEIRAWRLARQFKLALYDLVAREPLSRDVDLRDQLRSAAASAESNISEGFGRFDPMDFARFLKIARGSLMECRSRLIDAADRGHITEDRRREHQSLADEALKEIGGLLDYLQSPEAKRNAERIRQQRIARRRRGRQTG